MARKVTVLHEFTWRGLDSQVNSGSESVSESPLLLSVGDPNFDPDFEPIFARSQELGYPIVLHQLDEEVNYFGGTRTRIGQPLTEKTFIYNTLGFPMDATTTATMFVISGTLDRYPKLEVVLPHAGGSFPGVAGRVVMLNDFTARHQGEDVPDPFGMRADVYRTIRDEIEAAMPELVMHLRGFFRPGN